MIKRIQHNRFMYILLLVVCIPMACVEPFEFESTSFEEALVVEARMTDEFKQQEVKLSKTHRLEEDGPDKETNATVEVIDDLGTLYQFDETEAGRYGSVDSFAIQPNREYQLSIRLANGRNYQSSFEATPPRAQIDRIYAERSTNPDGFEGLSIFVDASNVEGDAQYFRYQYEETYKLIIPEWKPFDLVVFPTNCCIDCDLVLQLRPQEQITCYVSPSRKNANILNINTSNLNSVQRHPVRFISDENYKMASRYSILVRQLVQTRDASVYFETLDNFSGSGSLFSQIQAGFIQGNIIAQENPEEPVLGYFEVATLDTERFFFNYTDFYPNENPPPFFISCDPLEFPIGQREDADCFTGYLKIRDREIIYLSETDGPPGSPFSYLYVPRLCGDCTAVGTPDIPEFWED